MGKTAEENIRFYIGEDGQAKQLTKLVDTIIKKKHSWMSGTHKEDCYSIANEVLWDISKRWDGERDFRGLLYQALENKIYSYVTAIGRDKNCAYQRDASGNKILDDDGRPIKIPDTSMNLLIGEDDNAVEYGATILGKNTVEGSSSLFVSKKVEDYLATLSQKEKNIVRLIMKGYDKKEICEDLRITESDFNKCMTSLRTYEKAKHLMKEDGHYKEEHVVMDVRILSERSKNTSYSVSSLEKQSNFGNIRSDHVLQRKSGQHSLLVKSGYIYSCIADDTLGPIYLSEEIKPNMKIMWLIDGKNRLADVIEYLNDMYAISKKIPRYMIQYQTIKKDEDGKRVLDNTGHPILEIKEYDIRGKKFSQLPEELQEKLKDRQIPAVIALDSTIEDIAYDIDRYNNSCAMNAAQRGWLGFGANAGYGEVIDNIANMEFFSPFFDGTSFTKSNNDKGGVRRVCVEAIVATNMLDKFNSDFKSACKLIGEEGTQAMITDLYDSVNRLSAVVDSYVSDLFNMTNCFIFISLFARFKKLGLEDSRYIDFLKEFKTNLHLVEVDGMTYDEFGNKSNKDKSVISHKLSHLDELMNRYFNGENDFPEDMKEYIDNFIDNCDANDVCDSETALASLKIVEETDEVVSDPDAFDRTLKYVDGVNEIISDFNGDLSFFVKANIPALIGIVKYAEENHFTDILKTWAEKFVEDISGDHEANEMLDIMIKSLITYNSNLNYAA